MDNEKPFLDKDQLKYLFGFIDASRKDLHIELSEDADILVAMHWNWDRTTFFVMQDSPIALSCPMEKY